jgi:2-polyprenyl-3-methyl-5-hydroxy-6-metoxy-1,4-benzoquinol methylase
MNSVKKLVWTDELIGRFWDYMAEKPKADQKYFTYQNSKGIVNFLSYFTELKGLKVLDFGCGKGFLIDRLLKRGSRVWGLDFSDDSISHVNLNFDSRMNWMGGIRGQGEKIPFYDDFFDIIVCVETIEHVHDNYLKNMFKELLRILKPSGIILFTTPNNEVIEDNFVYCPSCETSFHRMQHVRNWSVQSLGEYLRNSGFQVNFIAGINFRSFQKNIVKTRSVLDLSPRKIVQMIEYHGCKFLALIGHKQIFFNYLVRKFNSQVHLAAVATKN